jgi:uncharacterized protein YecE (DUF72 family)
MALSDITSVVTATAPSVAGVHVGTSGWSYAGWKPGFYPPDARSEDFLRHYSERFDTVELNTTGYRLPAEEQFDRWAAQTPTGFEFAVKMPPRGLRDLGTFEERVRRLGDRLGPVRAVLSAPRDDGLLTYLLGSADSAVRYAFDFRHETWGDPAVDERLGEAGAVRVNAYDGAAPFRYLRFRDPPYSGDDLQQAADRITAVRAGTEVYAYFRHEDEPTAPAYAARLLELLSSRV